MMASTKLNIFQRGILQKGATALVYFTGIATGALILDWVDKKYFTNIIEEAKRREIITSDAFINLQSLITARDRTEIFDIILIGIACVWVGWFLMHSAAKLNWSWPTTLSKAVEFRSALRKLGVIAPDEQIVFVKKHKIPVFIARSPLIEEEQESVRAKLYAFAHHPSFGEKDIFERHIGKQTLCLDAEDYEQIVKNANQHFSLKESIVIAEKNDEIKSLRTALTSAVQENGELLKERDGLRNKVRIQPAQEEGRVERVRIEFLLWSAYIPVIQQLLHEAPKEKRYTTPEIENAFADEWKRREDLRECMKVLTGSEAAAPSESFMKAVKSEFKAHGKLSIGGRPRKNL